MRAISLIALLLTGCGDDTNVAADMAMQGPRPSSCEMNGDCCCGGPVVPDPKSCIPFAGIGQPCSAGASCHINAEAGEHCICATSGTWICIAHSPDMVPYPPLDMTTHD